jgi:hypothetical protein
LLLIWLSLLFEILILSFIKPLIDDFEFTSILAVSLHVLFVMIIILAMRNKLKLIFLGAFFTRVLFMVWDLYARGIFLLPNSGGDSEMFYDYSIAISENISKIGSMEGGFYSKIVGFIFFLIGPQRMFAQYLNVLIGLSVVFIIYKILKMLDVKPRIIMPIILIAAFFPNSMIMSAIFLREIIPTFFVVCSIYYFIKWFKLGKYANMFISLFMLGFASMFHSGVIGILFGYTFVFLFYKIEIKAYRFNTRTVFVFLILLTLGTLAYTYFNETLLAKFNKVEDISDIYQVANSRLGGSAYLNNIQINNPLQLVIYGPIKTFYFLTSPLPMNWRGGMDIFTFISDSSLYLLTLLYAIKYKKWIIENKSLVFALILIIIGVSFIFGIGVSNAGTAIRHRQKIFPIFLILLALIMNGKHKLVRKKSKI